MSRLSTVGGQRERGNAMSVNVSDTHASLDPPSSSTTSAADQARRRAYKASLHCVSAHLTSTHRRCGLSPIDSDRARPSVTSEI